MVNHLVLASTERQSTEALLSDNGEKGYEEQLECPLLRQRKRSWCKYNRPQLLLALLLLILNTLFCISYARWTESRYASSCAAPNTPARDMIEFETKQFDIREVNFKNGTFNKAKPPFNGPPSPELAQEWRNLMQHQNVRLHKDQLGSFANDENTESLVALSDGSGYLTTLAVFHGLHCLKRLHHYVYREDYYQNISEADSHTLLYHTEHCLDWLRQYIQCNADMTLVPFYWGTNQKSPLYVDISEHQCVKWEPLEQWMSEHSFDAFEPGLLVHPVYGDPYGPDFEDKIGISVEEHILHIDHD